VTIFSGTCAYDQKAARFESLARCRLQYLCSHGHHRDFTQRYKLEMFMRNLVQSQLVNLVCCVRKRRILIVINHISYVLLGLQISVTELAMSVRLNDSEAPDRAQRQRREFA
jgi:hypothetical protein